MWKGHVINWSFDSGAEFKITAADGLYELNLPYPTRKISRSCWKAFDTWACTYTAHGAMDDTHYPDALPTECDKGYDTPNGCLAHGMKTYYGAIMAEPQSVRITDNSTGVWGFGRSPLTSVSLVADSIYDQVLTEIYTDADMPVNCKVAAGRDESDYYEALGIVGEGPLGAYTTARMVDKDGDGKPETFVGHTLDGQYHHGYPGSLGLRQCLGTDPVGATDFFSLDQSGDQTGGDWRKVHSGQSTYKDNFAAGTAFIVIRRLDAKGLQLSKPGEHAMSAVVGQGLRGWVWTASGSRQYLPLTNPVWIAVNMLLRARGLRGIPVLALGDIQIPVTLPPSSFFGFSGSIPGIFKAGLYFGNPVALIAGLVGLIGGAFTGNAFSVPMSNAANQAELLLQANKDTWNGLPSIYRSTANRAIFAGNFDVVWSAYVAACNVIFHGDPNGSDAKKALAASIGDRNHGGKFDWYVSYRDPIANDATPGDGYVDPVVAQVTVAETLFDLQAAIGAAGVCNDSVTSIVGTGVETQFKFRGALQEEKPLKDWIQEVLMNCLGYYTFAFGKFKIGVRDNSSVVEAFTVGNIVFNSLQLAALRPGFNHLTANFADQQFLYVANSVSVYDIDHAALIGGGAGPMFLKSNVNLSGTSSKSQAGRIVESRLREELGGITAAEWKAARQISFRTTVLALNTEPGMVCSMTHADMPGGAGEFRVTSWKLNKDYSIDIQGRTTTNSMYDLVTGPKPADVEASPVPDEIFHDTGVPGAITGTPVLGDYGTFAVDNLVVVPDASGNDNVAGTTGMILAAYYVDELTTDLWASLDAALDDATDPAAVNCTVNPDTARIFKVGGFVVFNDEAADANYAGRRSYECAQITEITGGQFTFQRAYPGVPVGQATFGTLRCAHMKHVRFYKLDMRIFGLAVRKGFFRTPGLPARVEGTIPCACIVATLVGVANHFGWGPFTVWPMSHHNEPFMPGDRTCSGGAYTFQIPRPACGAGQRGNPDEGSGRRFDPLRLRVLAARDQRWPVGIRREVLVRRRRDVECAGDDGHCTEHRDAVQEHLGLPRGAGLRSAGDAPPALQRLRADHDGVDHRQRHSTDNPNHRHRTRSGTLRFLRSWRCNGGVRGSPGGRSG